MSQIGNIRTANANMSSKRRRFQPPITTYFSSTPTSNFSNYSSGGNSSTSSSLSHQHYSAPTCSPMPVVPATVQSSLLSVGMRVRKSVAEGYKTKAGEKKFGMSGSYGNNKGIHNNVAVEQHPAVPCSSSLLATTTAHGSVVTDDGDAFSLPSSSQESSSSDKLNVDEMAQAHGRRKRRFNSDLEDEDQDDYGTWADPAFGRTILYPSLGQQKRKFIAMNRQQKPMLKNQAAMDLDGDFEEPSFLRRREEVDNDYDAGGGREFTMDDA